VTLLPYAPTRFLLTFPYTYFKLYQAAASAVDLRGQIVQKYFLYYSFATCFAVPAVVIIYFYCKIVIEMVQAEKRQSRIRRKKTNTYKKV